MSGITDLQTLIASMQPVLQPGDFVFCTIPGARYGSHAELAPIGAFQEAEGLTLILPQAHADAAGLAYDGTFRCITLLVHSSLSAVGLTAAFAGELGRHGISANVIAGFYHDHIFVQAQHADAALEALVSLAERTRAASM